MATTTKATTTESETVKPVKKKFAATDLIPCVSITPGEMFYVGAKSKTLQTFADMDYVVEIEFRDLDYSARTNDPLMYRPRFIVQDPDFVALFPKLGEVYDSLYTNKDIREILKMQPKQMKKAILSLPEGAKDALKTIATTMIDEGKLDSINRIKVLDSIFNTNMLIKMTT